MTQSHLPRFDLWEVEKAYKNITRHLPNPPRPFQTPIMRRILVGISLVGKMGNDGKIEVTKYGMDLHLDGFMVDAPWQIG